MKCYNALFSKYGLLKNLGNFILLLIILIFASSSILFYKVGYVMLCNKLKEVQTKASQARVNPVNQILKKEKVQKEL